MYEAEARRLPIRDLLSRQDLPPTPSAVDLIEGVADHLAAIDALLEEVSVGWPVERMAQVDRAILRIATYELTHRPDTPAAVVLNEAVELANLYSTDHSGRFVNGVLANIARRVRPVPWPDAPRGPETGGRTGEEALT